MRAAAVGLVLAASLLTGSTLAGCARPGPAPARPAPVAVAPCLSQLQDALFLTCLRTEVDEVWGAALRDTGRAYRSMPLTVGDENRTPGPGGDDGDDGDDEPDRAYFNRRTGTHFPQVYLDAVQTAHGTGAHLVLTFVMAHEVGHHVQFLLHAGDEALINDIEAQADCYAGVWGRRAADGGRLDVATFRAAAEAELRRLSSSYAGEVESHGSTAERVASLDKGLRGGDPAACDIGRLRWR